MEIEVNVRDLYVLISELKLEKYVIGRKWNLHITQTIVEVKQV